MVEPDLFHRLTAFANGSAMTTNKTIAVFDAGIGSYQIARKIADRYPAQDVIYFADRANFPYGSKTRGQLLQIMRDTIARLTSYDPAAIVIASNAPSVMVLEELQVDSAIPLIGVFPPVRKALSLSQTGHVAVLGVDSLIASAEIRDYVAREAADAGPNHSHVSLIAASDLVGYVESGAFLTAPEQTLGAVRDKLASLDPRIDVITLSSTHLPWLMRYFKQASAITALDPADDVVELLAPYVTPGAGSFTTLLSEREGYDLNGFIAMTDRLGLHLDVTCI